MANYCRNVLSITSDNVALIDRLVAIANPPKQSVFSKLLGRLFGKVDEPHPGLLEFFLPIPEALRATITNGFSDRTPEWHQWQVENWGCAYDVAVDETTRAVANEVVFRFDSRYSPPIGAIVHGAKQHRFSFRMLYCETGAQFAGIVTEEDHREFEFTFDAHPVEEGVPQEIIDEFDLTANYEEIRQELRDDSS